MIFYFAGFIAQAVFLSKLLLCHGTVCHAARADAVFAAFSWALWTGSTAILAMEVFRGGLRGVKNRGQGMAAMKETAPTSNV
jgi:hypothetical protein